VPHVEVNGVVLRYRIDGLASGPWLTMSNSLLTDLSMWQPQVAALRDRYSVLRYDQRGHGGSELGDQPLSFELLAGDLAALLAVLGVRRTHVMGSSMGGTTGLVLAAVRADLVASLVVAGSRPCATDASAAGWRTRMARARDEGVAALAEETIQRWFTPASCAADPAWLRDVRAVMTSSSTAAYLAVADLLARYDVREYLGRVTRPVLFVAGSHDPGAVESLRGSAAEVAGAGFRAVAPAGHLPSVERPAEFTGLLTTFLDRVDGGGGGG
jgi:3-oxoadipate enol-lactonase